MRRPIMQLGIATALFLVAVGTVSCSGLTGASAAEERSEPLEASGFIEAEEVSVVSEVSGRVAEVLVDEADRVIAGQVVVQLDDGLLQAERAQAQAAVFVAEANLAELKAGAAEEELAAAEATLKEAEANVEGSKRVAGAAWWAASNPYDIDVQIASAETEVELALRQIELIKVQLEEERFWLENLRKGDPLDETAIEFKEYTIQILEANLRAAEARYEGAVKKLELLREYRRRPMGAIARARQAQTQIGIAEAQLELAQAQYDLVVADPLLQELAIATAQVALAEAIVALIDARVAQLTLVAPLDGVVTTRAVHPGETASPGVPLLTITNLSRLKLVVYIPETEIGRVQLGAPVEIAVDAYPNRTFEGEILFIAREAEFTPRNVQTEEERVNLVFAVEIWIDNEDGALKPGMPADVVIKTED